VGWVSDTTRGRWHYADAPGLFSPLEWYVFHCSSSALSLVSVTITRQSKQNSIHSPL
jgi:hypothetical protein